MNGKKIYYLLQVLLMLIFLCPSYAETSPILTEEQVLSLGTEAYIYGYPLVMMDMTKQVMTNVKSPQGLRAPLNVLTFARDLPNATFKDVTSPNEDMLYFGAWVNLADQPYVMHVPTMKDRFYIIGIVDAWTNVFADPGTRTTGEKAQSYVIVGPHWNGKVPAGLTKIQASTDLVWILGRIYCNGNPEDYLAVRQLQDGMSLVPLSQYGTKEITPVVGKVNLKINMTIPVSQQVNALDASAFFRRLAMLMKENPPAARDSNMLGKLKLLGIEPGQPFMLYKQPEVVIRGLEKAVREGQRQIMAHSLKAGMYKNGWLYSMRTGEYGQDYLQRAFIATIRLGAYSPQDVIYMRGIAEKSGNRLDGNDKHVLHFEKNQLPPVNAFWSLTMYNEQQLFVDNPLNRYNRTSFDKMNYNPDGSLDIYIQYAKPDKKMKANWLPAPNGKYILLLRLYWPKTSVLKKKWDPPAIT